MTKYIETNQVDGTGIVVIDRNTGTVVGTDLTMCYVPEGFMDAVLSSDSAAREYASTYGIPLFVRSSLDD